jgi:hypothetical protein
LLERRLERARREPQAFISPQLLSRHLQSRRPSLLRRPRSSRLLEVNHGRPCQSVWRRWSNFK